jgi:hypothetical protein
MRTARPAYDGELGTVNSRSRHWASSAELGPKGGRREIIRASAVRLLVMTVRASRTAGVGSPSFPSEARRRRLRTPSGKVLVTSVAPWLPRREAIPHNLQTNHIFLTQERDYRRAGCRPPSLLCRLPASRLRGPAVGLLVCAPLPAAALLGFDGPYSDKRIEALARPPVAQIQSLEALRQVEAPALELSVAQRSQIHSAAASWLIDCARR